MYLYIHLYLYIYINIFIKKIQILFRLRLKRFKKENLIYQRLIKLIINGPINEETQIKIEYLLKNQYELFLLNKINSNSDINFYKLNTSLFKVLDNNKILIKKFYSTIK